MLTRNQLTRYTQVFFGTPHRARTQVRWEIIAESLLSTASHSGNRSELSQALMRISQDLELLPGVFGVWNGYRASGVSPIILFLQHHC